MRIEVTGLGSLGGADYLKSLPVGWWVIPPRGDGIKSSPKVKAAQRRREASTQPRARTGPRCIAYSHGRRRKKYTAQPGEAGTDVELRPARIYSVPSSNLRPLSIDDGARIYQQILSPPRLYAAAFCPRVRKATPMREHGETPESERLQRSMA